VVDEDEAARAGLDGAPKRLHPVDKPRARWRRRRGDRDGVGHVDGVDLRGRPVADVDELAGHRSARGVRQCQRGKLARSVGPVRAGRRHGQRRVLSLPGRQLERLRVDGLDAGVFEHVGDERRRRTLAVAPGHPAPDRGEIGEESPRRVGRPRPAQGRGERAILCGHPLDRSVVALLVSGVVGLVLASTTPRTGFMLYLVTIGWYAAVLIFRLFQVIVRMMEAGFQGQTTGENAVSE